MNNKCRELFKEAGLTYQDVLKNFVSLKGLLDEAFKKHKKDAPKMKMSLSKKFDKTFNENLELTEIYLYVNGAYFKKKE